MENYSLEEIETPVLVVGAGPSGLITSLALDQLGISHILIDRHFTPANTPRAHIINQRTMEIFRCLGIEDGAMALNTVNAMGTGTSDMPPTYWIDKLVEPEIFCVEAWGGGDRHRGRYRRASPCRMANIPQNALEPVLLKHVADSKNCALRMGYELRSLRAEQEHVIAVLEDRSRAQQVVVKAIYVVGADGANSAVAREIGLDYEGISGVTGIAYAWIEADLAEHCAYRPSIIYAAIAPDEGATFVNVKPWHEWVVAWKLENDRIFGESDEEEVLERVYHAIGSRAHPVQLKNISCWKINKLCATRYGRGRIFCVGDAVHRHPTTNGLGLNTGVADGFNIAWKLALVLRGKASSALLESYGIERQPVGKQVVERSFRSLLDLARVSSAFGIKFGQSSDQRRRAIAATRCSDSAGIGHRKHIDEIRALMDYNFNAHGIELGYQYKAGALIAEGCMLPSASIGDEITYVPDTKPGARLPHVWICRGRRDVSTLDLAGNGAFSLFTGPGGENWASAARAAQNATGVRINFWNIDGAQSNLRDKFGRWRQVKAISDSGAILVRPDQHVAWRAQSIDQSVNLDAVMRRILKPG